MIAKKKKKRGREKNKDFNFSITKQNQNPVITHDTPSGVELAQREVKVMILQTGVSLLLLNAMVDTNETGRSQIDKSGSYSGINNVLEEDQNY